MSETTGATSITLRLPSSLIKSIDEQAKQTRQSKTDVIVGMLLSSIPSLHITDRAKLPSKPGIYFVYTPDHTVLYIGKADNLRTRWNSHHKYQYFIESSIECRIGYFTFDSVNSLTETIEEFKVAKTNTWTVGDSAARSQSYRSLIQEQTRQISRIGNNLNQIAKWVNTYKSTAEALEIIEALRVIEKTLNQLSTKEPTSFPEAQGGVGLLNRCSSVYVPQRMSVERHSCG